MLEAFDGLTLSRLQSTSLHPLVVIFSVGVLRVILRCRLDWAELLGVSVKRRDFIRFLGSVVLFSPTAASAQVPGRTYRVGSLHSAPLTAPHHVAFFDELRRAGFVEGQNLTVDKLGYGLRQEQFSAHAAELATAKVDAILCAGDLAIREAQQVTGTIPILGITEDMVRAGLARSLSKPGGNTTGVSILASDLDIKRQEILSEMMPTARRIAVLADTNNIAPHQLETLEAARLRAASRF